MEIIKLVNANKEGQERRAAMLTDVGHIVEVRYNESTLQIEFYYKNGFLGSTSSKKSEGYALVRKVEALFKGYHFTLDYYPGLSEEEMLEIQTNFYKKEKIKQAIQKKIQLLKASQLPSHLYQGQGRSTHCWRCGATLTSQTHSKCQSCNWLICSCGTCKQGCTTY
jgi:hypothetical protein